MRSDKVEGSRPEPAAPHPTDFEIMQIIRSLSDGDVPLPAGPLVDHASLCDSCRRRFETLRSFERSHPESIALPPKRRSAGILPYLLAFGFILALLLVLGSLLSG